MISIPIIYRAFGLTTLPKPPHCFQIERVGDIILPVMRAQEDGQLTKLILMTPHNASLSAQRIETIIRACRHEEALEGPDVFVSHDRAQNTRFHILSPSRRDESQNALKLLAKLAKYLTGQDRAHV